MGAVRQERLSPEWKGVVGGELDDNGNRSGLGLWLAGAVCGGTREYLQMRTCRHQRFTLFSFPAVCVSQSGWIRCGLMRGAVANEWSTSVLPVICYFSLSETQRTVLNIRNFSICTGTIRAHARMSGTVVMHCPACLHMESATGRSTLLVCE